MSLRAIMPAGLAGLLLVACTTSSTDAVDGGTTTTPDTADSSVPSADVAAETKADTTDSADSSEADVATEADTTDTALPLTPPAGTTCAPDGSIGKMLCGKCGIAKRNCEKGLWLPFGPCEEPAVCTVGATAIAECGKCGAASAVCSPGCTWTFGPCGSEGLCAGGDSETKSWACPDGRVLTSTRTCSTKCTWGAWSPLGSCD